MVNFGWVVRLLHDMIIPYNINIDDKEIYYISPPTKSIFKNLTAVWISFFIMFLLTFKGREVLIIFFLPPTLTGLYFYSKTWGKSGFSILMYWVINVTVLSNLYLLSRIIHMAVKMILFLIGVI